MHDEPTDEAVNELLLEANGVIRQYYDVITRMLREAEQSNPDLVYTVNGLTFFIVERCRAAFILLSHRLVWDAEILLRAIAEATVRILFICYSDENERQQKLDEYWNNLAEINKLRRSTRAQAALNRFDTANPTNSVLQSIILTPTEEQQIRAVFPRRRSNEISQRWSTTRIIAELEQKLHTKYEDTLFASFVYSYGISSHLIHADESGVTQARSYIDLPEGEQTRMEKGHICKLLTDIVTFIGLIALAIVDELDGNSEYLRQSAQAYNVLLSKLEPVTNAFLESEINRAN